MLSAADPEAAGTTEQAPAPAAVAVPPVWDLEAAVVAAVEAVVDGGRTEKGALR
jgi:hypothetical protein